MDDALIDRFLEIFDRDQDWSRSRRHARRAGLMIFLHPKKDKDWVTGVRWDPALFVRQPMHKSENSPVAWRRDFVEKVVAMNGVPDLEQYPDASL